MRTLQRLSWLIIACSILGASAPAFAQGGRAEINGTVVDAQKAVLPGATVTATSEDTGLVREAVADATGRFVMPSLLQLVLGSWELISMFRLSSRFPADNSEIF